MRSSKPAGTGRAAWQWRGCRRETATRTGIDRGEKYLARVKKFTFETSTTGQIAAQCSSRVAVGKLTYSQGGRNEPTGRSRWSGRSGWRRRRWWRRRSGRSRWCRRRGRGRWHVPWHAGRCLCQSDHGGCAHPRREGTIVVPENPTPHTIRLRADLPGIDDPMQMERWEPWVRAYTAVGEMLQGITFGRRATHSRSGHRGHIVIAEIGRPERSDVRGTDSNGAQLGRTA